VILELVEEAEVLTAEFSLGGRGSGFTKLPEHSKEGAKPRFMFTLPLPLAFIAIRGIHFDALPANCGTTMPHPLIKEIGYIN
jgi:hypothetical protein